MLTNDEQASIAVFTPAGQPQWDEKWDAWARSAIASGALVPPHDGRSSGSPLVVVALLLLALPILAGWLWWGFAH